MRLELTEESTFTRQRIDRKAGIVHSVKIIGMKSKHGYDYTKNALKNAIPLYEGCNVNIDHPNSARVSRRYGDRFGSLHNVTLLEDGLYGDLHYNKYHRLARQFVYDAVKNPKRCGLSHNATGDGDKRGGRIYVENIDKVRSVDVVANPATTNSLFESVEGKSMVKMLARKRKRALVRKATKRRQLREDEGGGGGAPTIGTVEQMILDGITKILTGTADNVTKAKKAAQLIKSGLKVKEDIDNTLADDSADSSEEEAALTEGMGLNGKKNKKRLLDKAKKKELSEDDPEDGDDEDDDDDVDELHKMRTEIAQLKRSQSVRDLCEGAGFRPSGVQLSALMAMKSDKQRKTLLESFQEGRKQPRRFGAAPPRSEAAERKQSGPKRRISTRDFVEAIRE